VLEVCQSTSEVRIQDSTINAKNLGYWNHPNMLSLDFFFGGGEGAITIAAKNKVDLSTSLRAFFEIF